MNTEQLACPYCNAFVSVAAGAAVGQRVPCPRCGEAFTLRQPPPLGPVGVQSIPAVLIAPPGVDFEVERRLRAGRNKRLTAAALLGVMGLMAAVSLAYALYTVSDRRAHDTAMPAPQRRSPLQDLALAPTPAVTPPASLEALRWLPPDCTVVAGVQFAELRQTDAGRDLLNHLFRVGKVDINADLLERWTGLKPEEVDHLVLGVKADEGIPPRSVLVVRTVRPYDADAVRTALQAESVGVRDGKTLYKCKPRDGGLRPILWCADERTLVFGLLEKHLEAVPNQPAAGLERLPAEVRTLLEERLDSAGPAWVVGYAADWRKTAAALLLGGLTEKDADLLGGVHGIALQLQAERPAKLLASVRCEDDAAAQALETRLLTAKPADADWKTARDGPWLTVQVRGEPTGCSRTSALISIR